MDCVSENPAAPTHTQRGDIKSRTVTNSVEELLVLASARRIVCALDFGVISLCERVHVCCFDRV